jgi:hypothetical protein
MSTTSASNIPIDKDRVLGKVDELFKEVVYELFCSYCEFTCNTRPGQVYTIKERQAILAKLAEKSNAKYQTLTKKEEDEWIM